MHPIKIIKKPINLIFTGLENSVTFLVSSKLSREELNFLSVLVAEAKETIADEITTFSDETLLNDSENKAKMSFKIGRAFFENELVGYSIGYCELQKLNEFYLDVVYIKSDHRNSGVGLGLAIQMINSINNVEHITDIKFITQKENKQAINLIKKIESLIKNSQ